MGTEYPGNHSILKSIIVKLCGIYISIGPSIFAKTCLSIYDIMCQTFTKKNDLKNKWQILQIQKKRRYSK